MLQHMYTRRKKALLIVIETGAIKYLVRMSDIVASGPLAAVSSL